jgi:dihydrolipoamide dehydrogenase
MAKKDFNVIVIGAGSAGLVSSYIAAAVKAKVALIERHKMGGDCLNTGCVPSKALIRSAKIISYIKRHEDYGIKSASATFDFADVMERVQKVIKKVEPHDSVERFTSLGVDCFTGDAKILSPHEVTVDGKTLTTKNIIIATGARPAVPNIPGLDKVPYLTSDTLWEIRGLPKRLVVVGGGPIGSELTQCFARLGSEVTQVERGPNIMNREDEEISQAIRERFTEEGVDVRTGSNFKEVVVENGRQFAVIEKDGTTEKIEFDKILIALGRAANSKGFGLEEIGVKLTERGTVEVDEYLRTTMHKNIYACGDVAGPYQFTHTAAHQAWYCAVNALFSPLKKFKVDYRVIPWCTFTDPEVAQVGLNEKAAKARGIPYEVTRYEIDDLDRAIADSEDHGVVKVLTVPGKDTILGVTILGYHAGDLIAEYVLAMKHGLGLNKILGTIHIYPTMAEANKFAAGNWKKAHAPKGLLRLIQKFHTWRR